MDNLNVNQTDARKVYEEYRDEAEKKLFKSVNRDLIIIIEFIGVFVIGRLISLLWSWDGEQFALALVFTNVPAVIGMMLMIVSVVVIFNCIRHVFRYVRIYKSDFRRIEEKLSNTGIYMTVPKEDVNKYNNPLKLVANSWKNREKNT